MKNKASAFLKQIVALLSSVAKAKSMAIKSRTSAVRSRVIMFSIMKSKKVLVSSISDEVHTILGHNNMDSQIGNEDQSKAVVLYNIALANESTSCCAQLADEIDADNEKYPDRTHSLFDEEEDFNDTGGSVIDLVKKSKDKGENFSLEDEIDHVADLFIMRFHKQMRLQKLESFKRFQEMLARSV